MELQPGESLYSTTDQTVGTVRKISQRKAKRLTLSSGSSIDPYARGPYDISPIQCPFAGLGCRHMF